MSTFSLYGYVDIALNHSPVLLTLILFQFSGVGEAALPRILKAT